MVLNESVFVCVYFNGSPAVCYISFQDCDNLWWDAFTTEFFEDDAMLTITFCLEDGPKRYSKKCLFSFFFKFHVMYSRYVGQDVLSGLLNKINSLCLQPLAGR